VHLTNPFVPQAAFSADEIAAIHDGALRVLQELGIRILLDEARQILQRNGALVDEATMMVRLGRDIVDQALARRPARWRMRAANPARERLCPRRSCCSAGARAAPTSATAPAAAAPAACRLHETLRLQQAFDVIHILGPSAEPQDIPAALRHLDMMRRRS
jgi:trimethylamine--corrinoid protein Co-methyltransferase